MLQIIFQGSFAGLFVAERGVIPGLSGWRRGYTRRLRAI